MIENYLEHFSASTINLFIRDKSKFILKVSGYDDFEGNLSTIRGSVVESQLLQVPFYKNKDIEEYLKDGKDFFKKELMGIQHKFDEKKVLKELADIPLYIMSGYPTYYNLLDAPVKTQSKITLDLPDVALPIIGYIDLECENTVRDLKTVRAIPSSVPFGVQRQLAIYSSATKKEPWVDYVSKKHCTTYKVDNVEDNIQEVIAICKSIEKFLAISNDIKEIASMFPPNRDSWEWNDDDNINWKKLGV